MRKLASIQRILDLTPIENADRIELASVLGWQVIVGKGIYKVGDLAVFFEIDAVPPATPVFEWLWAPLAAPTPSFRIRTKKMKGVISQGILVPLSELVEMQELADVPEEEHEGLDVTELLGVTKYEPKPKLQSNGKPGEPPYGAFAADVPKTDEERIQSIGTKIFEEMAGEPYVITEKADGTSATFAFDADGVFRVYGRNWEIKPGDNHYWNVARLHKIEDALRYSRAHGNDWALQGEIVGPGIQKNRYELKQHELRAFTLHDKQLGRRGHVELVGFCDYWKIPMCRTITSGDSFAYTQDELLKLAEGKYEGTKNEREGIVVRPLTPKHSRILGGSLSFKVISNRYLLKETDE